MRQDQPISARALHRERVKISQNVAAGIAHELRNPVFSIVSAAQLLRYRIADDPVVEKNIGRILRETERLSALVEALLEYGRPAPIRLSSADPDDVWTNVLVNHRGLLESKALLVRRTPAEPRATCNIDAEQLSQAFSNILANAIDAAPEGSDLAILSTRTADGAWQAELHNDGPAIAEDLVPHVFEPLVTTKLGHAGIGLAVVHRVMSEHGGSASLESAKATGTTLTVTLPAARLS
ncbi:MAG TPA: ATP-binding protein [Gemmatimonadaceae bacterium]|nr:ATP-binding protein [Gemmatimonadaceae bacterium]